MIGCYLSKKGFSYRSRAIKPPIKAGNIKSSSQKPAKDLDIISCISNSKIIIAKPPNENIIRFLNDKAALKNFFILFFLLLVKPWI